VVTAPPVVAVLGTGRVGRTLAAGWARAGHRVVLGTRDPAGASAREAGSNVGRSAGVPVGAERHERAAQDADVVVVAIPGAAVPDLVRGIGDALAGKLVVDTTNDLAPGATLSGVATLVAAGAVVYRAFNSTGWEQLADPWFGALRSDMPFAGPDGPHLALVRGLVADLGFRPVYVGEGQAAHDAVDNLARLWFALAFGQRWGRRLGFRFLTAADDVQAAQEDEA
jgi:predicted dinucleotide-binding enzyme